MILQASPLVFQLPWVHACRGNNSIALSCRGSCKEKYIGAHAELRYCVPGDHRNLSAGNTALETN